MYSQEDREKDNREISKRRTQQQFSRFSVAQNNAINVVNTAVGNPAVQIETKPQIGDPINDTYGTVGFITQTILLDVYGSNYSTLTINGDVDFVFDKIPQGRHIAFTIDFVVDTPTPPTVNLDARVVNPPTLPTLVDTLRVILHFEGVSDDVDTRFFYVGGTAGSTTISGANVFLSNLSSPTSINQDLLPQAGKTLGDFGNIWSTLWVNNVKFGSAGVVDAAVNMVYGTATGLELNGITGASITFRNNATLIGSINNNGLSMATGKFVSTQQLTLNISAITPSIAGVMVSDGTDILVYSGGAIRNLSDIAAGGAANTALSNLTTTSINEHLIPQAGKTLGNSGSIWSSAWVNNVKFGTAGVIDATINMVYGTATGLEHNSPTGSSTTFRINGALIGSFNNNGLAMATGAFVSTQQLTLNVSAITPSIAGVFASDGTDVFVYSGGAVRNMTDIGSGGGANTALSNLASVSINDHLIPQAGKTLGSSGNEWSALWTNNVKFGTAGVIDTALNMVYGTATGLEHNSPTGSSTTFRINGTLIGSFNNNGLAMATAMFVSTQQLTLNVSAITPSVAGVFASDGTDVYVYSGGALRSFSDITAAAGNIILQGNSNVTVTDTGSGVVTTDVDGATRISSISSGTTFFHQIIMSGAGINMNSQNITSAHQIEFENTGTSSSVTPRISASSTEMIFSMPSGDFYSYYVSGTMQVQIRDDGEIRWGSTRAHRIIANGTDFQLISENSGDEITLWNGTSRSAPTVQVENADTTWRTGTAETTPYILNIIQNHDTPAINRQIALIQAMAEDSTSVDTVYAYIEMNTGSQAGSVTNGTENGYLSLNVISNGSPVSVIAIEGNSAGRQLGFFGTAPVIKQTVASDTLANLYTALRAYGLIT